MAHDPFAPGAQTRMCEGRVRWNGGVLEQLWSFITVGDDKQIAETHQEWLPIETVEEPAPSTPVGRADEWTATVRIVLEPREDGGLRVWSDDLPGLILSHSDPDLVIADLSPALLALRSAIRAIRPPGGGGGT